MRTATRLALLLAIGLVGPGCAAHAPAPAPARGAAEPQAFPARFSVAGEAPSDGRWWTAFGDPVLDRLVDTALSGSFSLRAARERVIEAAALARRAGAPLRPRLDGTATVGGITTRRDTDAGVVSDSAEELSLGLAAAWELDLWGRLGASRDAAVLDARAAHADLQTARIALSALVATTWYGYVEESRIATLLQEQIDTNETLETLIQARFQQGEGAAADVLRQQQLVERTRGDLSLVASRRAVLGHQLATLRGRPATEPPPPAPPGLIAPPPLPATGIPSETLNRRPDVTAAWLRVLAADRDLAAAIADRYPSVSLNAGAAVGGAGLEVFFLDRLASIAAELTAPLLDGGRRRAQIEADAAVRYERVHEYSEALLVALREVEDALVREAREREHLASLERQYALARQVVETLLTRYGQGASAYLDVLAAVQSEQSLAVNLVTSRRQLIEHRIALCRAIAGPWPAAACVSPPSPQAGDPCGSTSRP
jgi:NodT family efflux transporter outer membrane factor (OMF) lipoprotein